jgi:glycosyltransferase involved in cell wall biosynthesis
VTIRLLAFCDNPAVHTGFGRVADHVLGPLARDYGYEVTICAINYTGDMPDPERYPFRLYNARGKRLSDAYGVGRVPELVGNLKPDCVWVLNDLPILRQYWQYAGMALNTVPTVTYSPVDGDPFPAPYLDGIREATVAAVYTPYARDVIAEMDAPLAERLKIIPHGHDAAEFYPLADTKEECKRLACERLVAEGVPITPDSFVVLRVDTNSERKNWPATLKAFAQFAQGKDDVWLWMHTQLDRGCDGYDLKELIGAYGIEGKVLDSGLRDDFDKRPVAWLNALYNLADVHLSTTSGGGWELSTHEAKAAGAPTIITDYAAMSFVGQSGWMLPVKAKYTAMRNSTEYAIVDTRFATVALEQAYWEPDLRAEKREACLRWAEGMTWDKLRVAGLFDAAIRQAIAEFHPVAEVWHG